MKSDKRFAREFGSMLTPMEKRDWIPWILDRFVVLTTCCFLMAVGAAIQRYIPLTAFVLFIVSGVGALSIFVSYTLVFITDGSDMPWED